MDGIDGVLVSRLGIERSDIDPRKITDLVVESYIFHEGLSDMTIEAINQSFKSKSIDKENDNLWSSFETNNIIAFALRSIILKATEIEE